MAQTFTHTLATESARFAEVLARTDPDADVPTCPDWNADDLLWHLTEVHAFWARILHTGAMTDEEVEAVEAAKPARPADRDAMLALFATETQALVDELRARPDDDTPAWFWLETAQTVGSTRRMQAHEATMHRIDAELTAGAAVTPLEPALAEDAVAHAFQAMWAWWGTLPGFTFAEVGVPVELAATDTGRRWLVQAGRWRGVGESGKSYDEPGAVLLDVAEPDATALLTAPLAEPAASVRGTAQELALWLWGRGPEPAATGDLDALTALRTVQATGMQ